MHKVHPQTDIVIKPIHNYLSRWYGKRGLTLYHTIQTFHESEEDAFKKHPKKRRKCWKPAFTPFPTVFSTLLKT